MSEQAPILPTTPHDMAIEAAQGANLAYSDLLVAKAARAAIEAAALAADNLGLEGVSVDPQAYDTIDTKIHEAEQNFELYGKMVVAVMPPHEGVQEEQPTREVAQASLPAPAPQPGKQEPKANARSTTHESSKPKDDPRQRYANILYEFLTRADENGVCKSKNADEVVRMVVGANKRQWHQSLTQLKDWRIITTEPGEEGRIAEVAVDWDMVEVNMGIGKIAPFPDGLTATDIMQAKWDAGDQAAETEPANQSDEEVSAPQADSQALPAAETKPSSKELYTKLLGKVLSQVDAGGTYESEDLQAELSQELGMTTTKLRSLVRKLIAWQCISVTQGPQGNLTGIKVDAKMVDREIIKRKIGLFPGEKEAVALFESRKRQLIRDAPDDADIPDGNDRAAVPKDPTTGKPRLSARVRKQLEIDARKGPSEALPDLSQLSEHEHAIIELRGQVDNLTDDQYFMLEPLAKVMLAFLKPNILEGSSEDGPSLMEQLQEATELTVEDIQPAYRLIRSREYLESMVEGKVRKPRPTRAALHFMRNAIEDAVEHS
ncbi:MAG TPA: hypothetical protein VNG32_04780 [Candidatus Dormibacteraeota bacterium]|nr:hypothetical protein [Candidatus Dormibacteraeota bacterium]